MPNAKKETLLVCAIQVSNPYAVQMLLDILHDDVAKGRRTSGQLSDMLASVLTLATDCVRSRFEVVTYAQKIGQPTEALKIKMERHCTVQELLEALVAPRKTYRF